MLGRRSHRCVECRSCPECKQGERLDSVSIQEEVEQSLIDRSVKVDVDSSTTTAMLPFLVDPDVRLISNERQALKVYQNQVKKLEQTPSDKTAVIASERKLHTLGFVDFVDNLCNEDRERIVNNRVKYFIPWRATWNENSLSTPCRLVFDASQSTIGNHSLNSLLAKGVNGMNNLVQILIRWTCKPFVFHTDIQKMYNAVHLDKNHWRYQMYLWDDNLNPQVQPRWKVIKTLIYGVRSSGNQAERGLRKTGEIMSSHYPRACEVITKDIYVDDCLAGEGSLEVRCKTTDELKLVLEKGGGGSL